MKEAEGEPSAAQILRRELRRFIGTLEAIVELMTLVPSIEELDRNLGPRYRVFVNRIGANLPPGDREKLERASDAAFRALVDEFVEKASKSTSEQSGAEFPTGFTLGESDAFKEAIEGVEVAAGSKSDVDTHKLIHELVTSLFSIPKISVQRQGVLLRSLLVTSVSAYESLLASVSGVYFSHAPGAMGSDVAEFSLKDLLALDDVKDAIEVAIDRRVDELIRRGFDGQVNWLKDKSLLGIDLRDRVTNWNRLVEAMERRHCIVHHGSTVSSQYVRKVDDSEEKVGDPLQVDVEYLKQAIDDLAEFGIYMTLAAWRKLKASDDNKLGELIRSDGYELLTAGSWRSALAAYSFGCELKATESNRTTCIVNRWLCRKKIYGTDAISDEVKAWDTTALSKVFRMARTALLEDWPAVFILARELLDGEEVAPSTLEEWPLLEGLRSYSDYEEWAEGDSRIIEYRNRNDPLT